MDLVERLEIAVEGPKECNVCGAKRSDTFNCGEPCSFIMDYGRHIANGPVNNALAGEALDEIKSLRKQLQVLLNPIV